MWTAGSPTWSAASRVGSAPTSRDADGRRDHQPQLPRRGRRAHCVVRIPGERTDCSASIGPARPRRRSRRRARPGAGGHRRASRRRHARHRVRRRRTGDHRGPRRTGRARGRRRVDPAPAPQRADRRSASRSSASSSGTPATRPQTVVGCRRSTTSCTTACTDRASAPPPAAGLCHNDLLPANVLLAADRHWLIDFEYAGMNQALFDLANLSVNCAFDEASRRAAARSPTTATRRIAGSPGSA